jgi:hypothetical protein
MEEGANNIDVPCTPPKMGEGENDTISLRRALLPKWGRGQTIPNERDNQPSVVLGGQDGFGEEMLGCVGRMLMHCFDRQVTQQKIKKRKYVVATTKTE